MNVETNTGCWLVRCTMEQCPVVQFPEGGIGVVCDAYVVGAIDIGTANVIGTIGVIANSVTSA